MKRYSISKLAKMCGLSRSTLLYYDRAGVLNPSGRTGKGYRYYTTAELRRLERIRHFREAGLSLQEIRSVFSSGGKPGTRLLERRMQAASANIASLRNQQRLLGGMLRQAASGRSPASFDKQLWVEMLRAAGMDESAMLRWHMEFERRASEEHHAFLLSLGIPPSEVERIRRMSRGEPASPAA